MSVHNTLKQLYDLDKASPQFHKNLTNLLRSKGYRNDVSDLQDEDLVWLVEYLNSVSLQTISPQSAPNTVVGSRVYFKSCQPRIPGILARTEKYLRCQRGPTKIVYTFKFPPGGHRAPISF